MTGHGFEWALARLKEGQKARRKEWGSEGWLEFWAAPSAKLVFMFEDGCAVTWGPNIPDLLAEDWELLQ